MLSSRFVFLLITAIAIASSPFPFGKALAQQPSSSEPRSEDSDGSEEITFWISVRSASDSSKLEAYLKAYPNGRFVPLAKVKLERLKRQTPPPRAKTKKENSPIPTFPPIKNDLGYLGVSLKFKAPPNWDKKAGRFEIMSIDDYGTASKSDLKTGDIVISANERRFITQREFIRFLQKQNKGSKLTFVVRRKKVPKIVVVEIGSRIETIWVGAHKKLPNPMALLGREYFHGRSLHSDFDKSYSWLRLAADSGDILGQRSLAVLYNTPRWHGKNSAKALQYFLKAGEQNDTYSLYAAAQLYQGPTAGIPKDELQAFSLYKKAAENNHAGSQFEMGEMYRKGSVVAKDMTKAAGWFELAADRGHVLSKGRLGMMYLTGQGGKEKNLRKASSLYHKAAIKGDSYSQYVLGRLYENGEGVPKNLQTAIHYYRRAQGNMKAAAGHLRRLGVPLYFPSKIQRLLNDLGFPSGKIDGKIGAKTRAAIRNYQHQAGLEMTGKPSLDLQSSLQRSLKQRLNSTANEQ